MKIATREIDGKLLVDISGPFPQDEEEIKDGDQVFRAALGGHDDFVLVLHGIDSVKSTDLGVLIRWIRAAGVRVGGLGSGPFVRIVSDKDGVRRVLGITDSPFRAYATEEQALAPERSGGLPNK